MAKEIDKLDLYDFDTVTQQGENFQPEDIPDLTRDNLIKVIDKQNEIIKVLNSYYNKGCNSKEECNAD